MLSSKSCSSNFVNGTIGIPLNPYFMAITKLDGFEVIKYIFELHRFFVSDNKFSNFPSRIPVSWKKIPETRNGKKTCGLRNFKLNLPILSLLWGLYPCFSWYFFISASLSKVFLFFYQMWRFSLQSNWLRSWSNWEIGYIEMEMISKNSCSARII